VIFSLIASGGVPESSGLRDIAPATKFGPAEVFDVRALLAELPAPVVLVLDDFQEITDDGVLQAFGELVDHLPPALRLVLVSRSDPPLRLHRLRVSGELTEIRTADLAFTESETAELFDGSGVHLAAAQAKVLHERTEGWPAGLRLAAMSLHSGDVQSQIDRFSGSELSVADYLVGEVTQRLSPADRDFLLKTSVVDRLNGELAGLVTGRTDGQQVLEELVRRNAFVVGLGGRQEWFTYHVLLRELLRHRLSLEQPAVVPELHQRVARWMSTQGEPIEAIRHFILAGDLPGAGRTLLTVIPRILTPDGQVLADAIQPLATTAPDHPSLAALLASATCHFHRHEYAAMLRAVEEARGFLDTAADDVTSSAEVLMLLYQMIAARSRADTAAVAELAGQTLEVVNRTPRELLPAGRAFRALAQINLAGAQLWTGQLKAAEAILDVAEAEAAELGLGLPRVNAIGHLALADAMRGRCRAADRRARQALQIADRRGWGSEPQALAAVLCSGLVQLTRQRPDTADGYVKRGLAASGKETDRAIRLALGIAAVQVAVCRRDADAALRADAKVVEGFGRTPAAPDLLVRWCAIAGAEALLLAGRPDDALTRIGTSGDVHEFVSCWERVTLARARLALGDLPVAEELIEPLLRSAAPYREPTVAGYLVRAVLADRYHRDTAAVAAITTAVDLAEPEDIRRPFQLIGDRLTDLLVRYRHLDGPHDGFVAALLPKTVSGRTASPDESPVEHLTERETMILRFLPTMLKAGEIAADLGVSVNTVKAHLRSVYGKLGVSNRRDAVERAKAARLL
jgi:LuxR family maltose regulon positive regulatory protein